MSQNEAPWVAKLKAARDIAATAEGAQRELTEDERKNISNLVADANNLQAKARAERKTRADLEQVEQMLAEEEAGEINKKALDGATLGGKSAGMTLGERFTKSNEYKSLMAAHPAGISQKSSVQMGTVQVPGGMKALLTSGGQTSGDAGTLVSPQQLGLQPYPYVAPKLRQVITQGTTNSDKVEYAQVVPTVAAAGTTNAAKGVKESPATTGSVGVKPESALAFRKASADVITIAHWMPVTKKTLSDAGQIRTIIDNFLRQGLEEEVERLILNGDKDAPTKGEEEWDGILKTSGLQNQTFDGDAPRTIRRAISKVTKLGATVNSVLVSPELDEELDLLKDSTGRYLGAGPWSQGPGTIWGRPRVVVPALSGTGKFILGDLSTCVLWDREQATITATDSHADFFIRNLVAVLAEMRAAFGIINPSLLVVGEEKAAG